ncbi:uncharacterized protein N7459_007009 [Penicillium hispanicum]|uniref:uncharacterized protein n=1 Tax=Penicillium hispanicum TaxID=1080232 RepID=UPI00253FE9A0|nr:uncharacterized protein N7459_007009 [Penicillium hispanicum]KAJ5578045.1 hypothetical protein N7459_007009 [Penicillium hispanicum]
MPSKDAPSHVAEEVYPVHTLDGIETNRNYVNWMMRFNDVLDAPKLNSALSRVLEIGDWRKMGGRLRYKTDGQPEIYVPRSSVTEQNVFFTHDTFEMTIQAHPVAHRFPKGTDGPSVQPITKDFRPFIARKEFPTFEQLVEQKLPLISLHITSFSDATLVAIMWPHVLMDVMGGQALLIGWTSVLNGREEDVPAVLGAREDILRHPEISQPGEKTEALKLEKTRLTGLGLLIFQLRFLWDNLWNPSRQRSVIFLPKSAVEKIRLQVQKDLENSHGPDSPPFVSEADILIAWATRVIASSESKSRPFTVMSLLNMRFRIPLLLTSRGAYIQNMVLGTYTFLSAQAARASVGSIALSHRAHVAEQATEQQTLSLLRQVFRDLEARRSLQLFFGDPHMIPIVVNNVFKADLMKIANFGAAVSRQGEAMNTRKNPLGTMVGYYNETLDGAFNSINIFLMLGKDYGDNYWFMGSLFPQAWSKIEEELGRI